MTKFKPGRSGNPQGRPKGSVNRQLAELREAAGRVLPLVVEKALDGDADAQRMILERGLPRMKAITPAEAFDLPEGELLEQIQAILRQVAKGEISPTAATEIVGLITSAAKVEEVDRLRHETNSLNRILEARRKS